MTTKQYRAAVEQLGLSQEAAGVFFGYSARQGQRWANNERAVPVAVAIAIQLMLKHNVRPADIK